MEPHDGTNDDNSERKQWLHSNYEQFLELNSRLPSSIRTKIEQISPNFEDEIQHKQNELKNDECIVLVKGETRRCLVDLMHAVLETTDLPVTDMVNSRCCFEIKRQKDKRKTAIFHFSDLPDGKRRSSPIIIDLSEQKDEFVKRIKENTDSDCNKYSRIELLLPLQFIKDGMILFVDTRPESIQCCQKVEGLVYMTDDEGGISTLKQVVGKLEFVSSDTMVIVFRADLAVDPQHTKIIRDAMETVKSDVTEQQFCYITGAKTASTDIQQTGYTTVQAKIGKMYPALFRNGHQRHYRWMSTILREHTMLIDSLCSVDTVEQTSKTKKLALLDQQTSFIEKHGEENIQTIKERIKQDTATLCTAVEKILKTDEVYQKLTTWELEDCPKTDSNWKKLAKEACEEIKCRIAQQLNRSEPLAKRANEIKKNAIRKIQTSLDLDDEQTKTVEGNLKAGDKNNLSSSLRQSSKGKGSVASLFKSSNSSSTQAVLIKGVGGAVVRDITFDSDDAKVKYLFKGYKSNTRCDIMAEAVKYLLNTNLQRDDLQHSVCVFFQDFFNKLDNMTIISDILTVNKRKTKELETEIYELENKQSLYYSLKTNFLSFQSNLDMFYIRSLVQENYTIKDLQFDPKECIGKGKTFNVFKGDVCSEGLTKRQVMIKVSKKSILSNTVSTLTRRERQMRILNHTNLVRYYGTTIRHRKRGKHLEMDMLLLLEPCNKTLHSFCISEKYPCPSRSSNAELDEARTNTARYATQICKGLDYLHSQNLIYGCFCLKNILMSSGGLLKLKDVDFKSPNQMPDMNDTFDVYTAPELLYEGGAFAYTSDVYSLGMVLWELWYGMDANEHIASQMFTNLRKSVKRGLRPALSITEIPPKEWIEVIRQCWNYEKGNRSDIANIIEIFHNEMHGFKD